MDDRNIRTALGGDGVLVASIDMPGRSMNVFSAELMDSVDRLLDTVAASADIKAVVLTSAKSTFVVGADLDMVRMFTQRARTDSPAALHELCGRLGRIFRRLETQGKPFVAAINGLALGGGLEVALACHERVAAESAQLGLPEVKWGLLPGAGGTQRLPRLAGQSLGLQLMLTGESRAAAQALEAGIIDAVVPPDGLLNEAHARALRLVGRPAVARWDLAGWRAPTTGTLDSDSVESFVGSLGIDAERRRLYPAHDAIIGCVFGGWMLPMTAAGDQEMDRFVALIQDPVAGNMISALFLDRQRASKATAGAPQQAARAWVTGPRANEVRMLLRSARIEVAESGPAAIIIATGDALSPLAQLGTIRSGTVAWLRDSLQSAPAFGAAVGVWVSDAGPFGRAVEVCVEPGADAAPGLDVARWLRATAMVTRGPSLLQRLAVAAAAPYATEYRLLAVALEAAKQWIEGSVEDLGIADSVAVLAGFHPPYTGGPYRYLRQRGERAIAAQASEAEAKYGAGFRLPEQWDDLWASLGRAA